MNKGGNMFAGVMIAIVLFMLGMLVVNFLMPEVTQARLDASCSDSANISDGTKLMCLFIDSTIIYWFILVFSIAGGIIGDKLLQ
jgi:hypothetical protein